MSGRDTRRSPAPGRMGLRAAVLTALLPGALACVTTGTYDALVAERDALASENALLAERLASVETSNEALSSKLSARDGELSEMRGTYDALVSELEEELTAGQVQIEQLRNGIRLNLSDEILFPSGSAQLDGRGSEVLEKVAAQIVTGPHRVEVEGHTDNVPITGPLTERYPTNWELAAARASRVVRHLQAQGIEGMRMHALSKGEFHPVVPNDSPKGRERNRRIEIRLIPMLRAEGDGPIPPAAASY